MGRKNIEKIAEYVGLRVTTLRAELALIEGSPAYKQTQRGREEANDLKSGADELQEVLNRIAKIENNEG